MDSTAAAAHERLDASHAWSAKDGTSVLVRPIAPDDFELEREFVDRLSPRTGYQRLLSPRKPSTAELLRWTQIDRAREGALIATIASGGLERQIGVARYVIEAEDGDAEVGRLLQVLCRLQNCTGGCVGLGLVGFAEECT